MKCNKWYENHTLQQLLYIRKNAKVVDSNDISANVEGITKKDLSKIDSAINMYLNQEDN